jgi:hypothetical protein
MGKAAIAPERTRFWQALRERAVQTNETTRAVTWLWPAALLGAAGKRRAIALVDIGTSAGLNLTADALPRTSSSAATDPRGPEWPSVRPRILRCGQTVCRSTCVPNRSDIVLRR